MWVIYRRFERLTLETGKSKISVTEVTGIRHHWWQDAQKELAEYERIPANYRRAGEILWRGWDAPVTGSITREWLFIKRVK